ncbi:hypothetical protein NMB32_04570 [Stenotrophomonas sp. CD2]|nr:hypothetical protein NMB32_04570 [Stenotrophomonas sp. CD2]
MQRVQLLRGYFDAEAATTVLQAQLLQLLQRRRGNGGPFGAFSACSRR